jgi:PKD repeat protein
MRGLLISILVLAVQSLTLANEPPVAIATADVNSGVAPLTVFFDGSQSYDPEEGPLIYDWDLNDGTNANTATVYHTYVDPGSYWVTFCVGDEQGAWDCEGLSITVNPPPPPHIQAYGQDVWCDGSSAAGGQLNAIDQNGHPLAYTLAAPPENGGVVIEPNGVFVYTPNIWDGNDKFWFTATDGNYVSNEAFVNLYVFNRPPVADAGPDQNIFTGDTAILNGSATSPDGIRIAAWMWSMFSAPDGSIWFFSSTDQPTVALRVLTPGDYVVALRVVDANGNSSAMDLVTVHAHDNLPPVAIATVDKTTVTVGEQVCFDGSQSYDPEGGPLIYDWDLDDGSNANTATVCHTYVNPGHYTVNFGVGDEHGAWDFEYLTITVNPPHIQAYSQVVWCDGLSVVGGQLNATDQNGHPLTYTLATPPENGGVVIEPNGAFVYTPNAWDGNDRFGFTASDGNVISNEAFVNLYIFERPPVADAGPDQNIYTGDTAILNGSATSPEGTPIVAWSWFMVTAPEDSEWNFGVADQPTATLRVLTSGDYIVALRVVDANGNSSALDYVTVHAADNLPPEAIPTAMPSFGEAPLTVQFTANAFDPNEDLLTYAWDFGDPLSADNNSTLENPTHIYDQNGFYHVALDVCDGLATINRSITIRAGRYGIDYLLGDIDFDGDVDFADVNEFTSAYLSENGDPDYNSDADLNPNDGFIDLYDFALLANDWQKFLP